MPESRLPAEPPAAVVLDAQAVASLRALDPQGKSQLLQRVVQAFEASSARLVPQLREALDSGDRQGIRHVAHTFKSSTASIGALALSRHCAELEALIRDGAAVADAELERRVHEVIGEVGAVVAALRQLDAAA